MLVRRCRRRHRERAAVDLGIDSFTVSSVTSTAGQFGYTIIPLNRVCPVQGCDLLVTTLSLDAADFEISASVFGVPLFDHKIHDMHIQNAGWVFGTWFPDGHFEIPAGAGQIAVTLSDNGTHTSLARPNGDANTAQAAEQVTQKVRGFTSQPEQPAQADAAQPKSKGFTIDLDEFDA